VQHGSITPTELRALGVQDMETIIDFSVNINPYGPTEAIRAAVEKLDFGRYPDPDALVLREELARALMRSPDEILVGNGAGELIWLTALAFLRSGDEALILGPTYGEYARAVILTGARPVFWNAQPHDDFAIHPHAIAEQLQRHPRVVFLCHPNNPTGRLFPLPELTVWLHHWPETLFVVDEAYLDFVEQGESALSLQMSNLLVLRSMTKAQSLAGLRLGYAVGPATMLDALRQMQIPWSVNIAAQAAGLAALHDAAHIVQQIQWLQRDKAHLVHELQRLGWRPLISATHYFLLHVGNAYDFRRRLLEHGVVVRDASSFGLPGYVRIATRRPEENQRLLEAIGRK
jgi:histidinol-phosphate aminotransferase